MRFAVFMWPKQPITTSGRWASTAATGTCHAGIGIRHTGPVKPSSRTQCSAKCEWTMIPVAGSTTHIVSGKSAARSAHKRLQQSVDDTVREQPSDDAVLVLHRVQVVVRLAAGDGHPGDEVVQHDVVQDDDARTLPQRLDDPRVRVRSCCRRGRGRRRSRAGHAGAASRP